MQETKMWFDRPMICNTEELDGSKYLSRVLLEFGKLIEEGKADPFIVFTTDCYITYITVDGTLVAFSVWFEHKQYKVLWAVFTYVDPNFRGSGVFKQLHDSLEVEAHKLNLRAIESYVTPTNTQSLRALEKVGRLPVYIVTRKPL